MRTEPSSYHHVKTWYSPSSQVRTRPSLFIQERRLWTPIMGVCSDNPSVVGNKVFTHALERDLCTVRTQTSPFLWLRKRYSHSHRSKQVIPYLSSHIGAFVLPSGENRTLILPPYSEVASTLMTGEDMASSLPSAETEHPPFPHMKM